MVIKRIVPKTIRDVATNLQSSAIKSFAIYEVNSRSDLDVTKQKLNVLWAQLSEQKTRLSIIAVVQNKESEGANSR